MRNSHPRQTLMKMSRTKFSLRLNQIKTIVVGTGIEMYSFVGTHKRPPGFEIQGIA